MEIAIILIVAYILGSIPSGLWVGKLFYKKDIRDYGSGNLGATNTFRTLGKKAGIVVTLLDILKGTAATIIPLLTGLPDIMLIAGVIAVIGHIFPVFAGFRGGKAVATSSGVVLGYAPLLFVLVVLVFLITLKLSKYVSLSSMAAALFGILYCIIFTDDLFLTIIVGVMAAFIVIRHKSNISRIRDKTEPKITWM
ncbi:glycerol-3-phosphate 1-O-acyltransferase PlsY [Jeotgalibacillus salarius]|uniref:Glycerol-3-phosphate acyltransferase n=1 Tax=Jeotgalibacillus salarius TaxID=546023 RepID=A0A4Y8LIV1_9BACL|nr:glycerol-3-phosphate 1-O-acyltransferase PlsY [Jeotgalibacillus salarius]TFE02926.1 glycerol-3-phosphate 1-O-acyltransferase PlsY [Jeotgalibacillus salarius]